MMVATMIERTEPVAVVLAERRVEVECVDCGRTLGVFGIRGDLPPGVVWTRLKCPNRRCERWNAFDVATGEPLGRRAC